MENALILHISKKYLYYRIFMNALLTAVIWGATGFVLMMLYAKSATSPGEVDAMAPMLFRIALVPAAAFLVMKMFRDLLYILRTEVQLHNDSFTVVLAGFGINRLSVPMNLFVLNEIRQGPLEALFGFATLKIGVPEMRSLSGVGYQEAVAFGKALSSKANRSMSGTS